MTRVALVTGSVARVKQLEEMLLSLERQDLAVSTLMIVEQQDPEAIHALTAKLDLSFDVAISTSARGLSRARNSVLSDLSDFDFVGFPDDDCRYFHNTLSAVAARFACDAGIDIVCGRQVSGMGDEAPETDHPFLVNRANVWQTAVSSVIFVRPHVFTQAGVFDECLGVGSGTRYNSGEETDFVLRAMEAGHSTWFDPAIVVSHPDPKATPGRLDPAVGYGYGCGMGYVLRRHGYSLAHMARHVGRPLVGAAFAALAGDLALARFRIAVARGRASGYRAYGRGA